MFEGKRDTQFLGQTDGRTDGQQRIKLAAIEPLQGQ